MQFLAHRETLYATTVLLLSSIIVHALPFFFYGPHPLGYDTGFYRRYLIEPFISFPNPAVPGLGDDALVPRILLDLVRLTHLSTDTILYGTYLMLFAILPVLLYLFLKPTLGERGALLAGLLLVFSSILYNAYWFMLFKNAVALDLLLLAFIALERRAWRWVVVFDILLALCHTTTALLYLSTLAVLFCISPGRRIEIAGHGALTVGIFAMVNIPRFHQVSVVFPTAFFIEWPQYLLFSLPLIILIAVGWRGIPLRTMPRTLIAFAIASFAFPILHLPFYQRIFVFTDVALIAIASFAAWYLFSRIDVRNLTTAMYGSGTALCIVLGLMLGNLYGEIRTLKPLISPSNVAKIQAVGLVVPKDATILTSSDEAPWYEGWTRAHIAAPGLLQDNHNFEAWESFWSAPSIDERIAFLDAFNKPLYVSTTEPFHELIGIPPACLKLVAPNLLLFACENGDD